MSNQGIYAILNNETGKVYIGSTALSFKRRKIEHWSALRHDHHFNPHLQHAWNKYGEDVFEFMICEYVEDEEHLDGREQYWLDWHRLQTDVYNMGMTIGREALGITRSDECRRKNSERQTGPLNHAYGKPMHPNSTVALLEATIKPYSAFRHRKTGEIIPAGVNLSKMCRERGLSIDGMWGVKSRKKCSYKGWELADNPKFQPGKPYPSFINWDTGKVIPAGNNLAAMCRQHGFSYSGMSGVAKGTSRCCHAWTLESSMRPPRADRYNRRGE